MADVQQENRQALRRTDKKDPFYLVLDGLLHISERQDPFRKGDRDGVLCDPDMRAVRPMTAELTSYDGCEVCQTRFEMVERQVERHGR